MAVVAVAAVLTAACGSRSRAIDSCVPSDTVVLASIDLEQARESPVYSKLPVPPLPEAARMMLAFNGKELLMIAQGKFSKPPAGWTPVESGLAVSGSEALVRAAIAPHAKARLVSQAERVSAGKPVWLIVQGGVPLPLSGNAENLNPLLAKSEYAYLTLTLKPQVEVVAAFTGRTDADAANIEKTLRGFLELARMGEKRGSEAKTILEAVAIERAARDVRASVSVSPEGFGKLIDSLTK
jgi:hypothetical protein